MPIDPRDLEQKIRILVTKSEWYSLRYDYRFSDQAWYSHAEVDVEERNQILDQVQLFTSSFGNKMEKMKYPTILIWLMGHGDL